ncbi:MAG: hypothetical protein WCI73_16875 [Phycisphaerae bacterium]
MFQQSRLPAVIVLLAILAPGGVMLLARSANGGADESRLAELKAAVAQYDAKPATWLLYAQTLQSLKKFPDAAWAYQQLLNIDPGNRQASLQAAVCLARADSRTEFYGFVKATILSDPKLAAEILGRPESQPFMADERFHALHAEALAQSMD